MAIQEHRGRHSAAAARCGFTLTELLIVIMIIAILAALAMSALSGATEMAREERTRSIVIKIDQHIMEKHEGYRTRQLPIPRSNAGFRLAAMRELMRMELPERKTDLIDYSFNPPRLRQPVTLSQPAALQRAYVRAAVRRLGGNPGDPSTWGVLNNWSDENQFAECLYLILSMMHDGDKSALDFFSSAEIGDTDDDGMPEILDAWGTPIQFLRWAPGYVANPWSGDPRHSVATLQYRRDPLGQSPFSADPFDPARADPRWHNTEEGDEPFELIPLIVSAGRDRSYDLYFEDHDPNTGSPQPLIYTAVGNDPYTKLPYAASQGADRYLGQPSFEGNGFGDNITNHYQPAR